MLTVQTKTIERTGTGRQFPPSFASLFHIFSRHQATWVIHVFCFKGIHNYGPRHLEQAVEFLSNTVDKYPYDELVSPSFDLDQINEAVELALSKKYLRVCVEPGRGNK